MFQVKMRYAGISEPYKLTRVYERDNKTKKTKSLQERPYMVKQYCAAHETFRYFELCSICLKGPKHEIFGFGFFYINQTYMDR
jgi:hypothetical protein